MTLKLGLPKGSLEHATIDLFRRAGFLITVAERSYFPAIDDPEIECMLVRAQEMARYVEDGALDCGLTGHDWVVENEATVHTVARPRLRQAELRQGALGARRAASSRRSRRPADLEGKIVATELVGVTRRWLAERGVTAKVEFSWGATEAKLPELADAIVEVTETGSSLRANKLRIVETVLESTTQFIANVDAWEDAGEAPQDRGHRRCCCRAPSPRSTRSASCSTCAPATSTRCWRCCRRCATPTISHLSDAGLARRQHDPRGDRGPRDHPAPQGGRRRGHRGVPAQQDRDVRRRRPQARPAPAALDSPTPVSRRARGRPPGPPARSGGRSSRAPRGRSPAPRCSRPGRRPAASPRPCTKRHAVSAAASASSESWS